MMTTTAAHDLDLDQHRIDRPLPSGDARREKSARDQSKFRLLTRSPARSSAS